MINLGSWVRTRYFIKPNRIIFNARCHNIGSYINYPDLSIIGKKLGNKVGRSSSTCIIVLFPAVAIFAFIRYRSHESNNVINQDQEVVPVSYIYESE